MVSEKCVSECVWRGATGVRSDEVSRVRRFCFSRRPLASTTVGKSSLGQLCCWLQPNKRTTVFFLSANKEKAKQNHQQPPDHLQLISPGIMQRTEELSDSFSAFTLFLFFVSLVFVRVSTLAKKNTFYFIFFGKKKNKHKKIIIIYKEFIKRHVWADTHCFAVLERAAVVRPYKQ